MPVARLLILTSSLLAPIATPVVGQAAPAGAIARELVRLKTDQRVRVAVGASRFVGHYRGIEGDSLTLLRDDLNQRLRLDQITAVWRRGRATKAGAIVGGVLGTGFGVFVGLLAGALCESGCDDTALYPVAGGLGFGAAGAGLGAIVGAAIPRWKRIAP